MSILVTLVLDCNVTFAEKPGTWTRLGRRKIIRVYRYPMMHTGNTELANDQGRFSQKFRKFRFGAKWKTFFLYTSSMPFAVFLSGQASLGPVSKNGG